MLPATVTGSWPRPRWYTMNMWGRPLDTAMMDPWYREQFTDAHAIVVSDQERAGLDIMTTGDYHLDEDVAGRSWHHYPLQRWKGSSTRSSRRRRRAPRSSPIRSGRCSTRSTRRGAGRASSTRSSTIRRTRSSTPRSGGSRSRARRPAGRSSSARARRRCSPSSSTARRDKYDLEDKKQLTWDMAEAMNLELRQLAASGCQAIQIEEPMLHFIARYDREETELIDFLVDCWNREVEGLDDVEIWIHTCWGNPNMQKVYRRRVLRELDRDLPRAPQRRRVDDRGQGERPRQLELFAPYEDKLKKKVASASSATAGSRPSPRKRSPTGSAARSSTSPATSSCCRPIAASAGRVQPARRLLQGDGDSAGAQHRAQRARARGALRTGRGPEARVGLLPDEEQFTHLKPLR